MKQLLRKKLIDPLVGLLKQGISTEKIALGVSVGAVIGIFPVIGATTLLSAAVALALRLNLPAVQLVNYVVYPLQVALLIPFFQFGAWLFGVEPLPLSATELMAMFKADFWGVVSRLWDTTMRAIVAWGVICLPLVIGLYVVLRPILQFLKSGKETR